MNNNKINTIKDWPICDRPREKLFIEGEQTLSNSELLAILIGTGMNGFSAIDIARLALKTHKTLRELGKLTVADLKKIKGLGEAKIAIIKAALEIGRRYRTEQYVDSSATIKSSQDIAQLLLPRMRDMIKEVFIGVFMNAKNRITKIITIEEGAVNFAHPIVRELFEQALRHNACNIICVHNHPSGDPKPSREDHEFTHVLMKAAEVLQMRICDHIIIGNNRYFSFTEERLMCYEE